jgi:uncharacterized protein YneF (UPF0154 family)
MEFIMDFLHFLLIFTLGWLVGTNLLKFKMYRIMMKVMKENPELNTVIKEPLLDIALLQTEHHNNNIFVYKVDTECFLCQGSSIEEVATKVKELCNINAAQVIHNGEYLLFVDGKIVTDDQ